MVHAENDACIRWLTERLLEAGKSGLRYHVAAHPEIGDREATHRAISLAELVEAPILIAHVAAAGAVDEIRRARARGLPVYGETCPQYLFLSAEDIDTPDLSGAKCVCTPPPRDKANQPAIWPGGNRRYARGLLLRPFALALRRQDQRRAGHAVHPCPERRARHRDAASLAVLGGGQWRAADHRAVRRAHRRRARQALRAVPAQGGDRRGRRCRPRGLGSRARSGHHQRHPPPQHRLHAL